MGQIQQLIEAHKAIAHVSKKHPNLGGGGYDSPIPLTDDLVPEVACALAFLRLCRHVKATRGLLIRPQARRGAVGRGVRMQRRSHMCRTLHVPARPAGGQEITQRIRGGVHPVRAGGGVMSTIKIGAPDVSLYPAEMRATRRWLCWRYLSGKKPPVDAQGKPLSNWKDPEAWLTWDAAAERMADNPDVAGLGFVLGDDGTDAWVGVDLDDCIYTEDGVDALGRKVKAGETHPQAVGPPGVPQGCLHREEPKRQGLQGIRPRTLFRVGRVQLQDRQVER